jgi:ribosomal protein L11 methyltransferase
MSHYKLSALVSDHGTARTLAMALEELLSPPAHATSLFEEGPHVRVEGYYEDQPDPAAITAQLAGVMVAAPVPDLALLAVPDENWVSVSQAALPPVAAGRFTVYGSHDRARVPRGPNSILVDAGEAFGTAHHATTQGCLLAIDRLTAGRAGVDLLDLGCGSGVLAIALARRFPGARITASDLDPIAVGVARENARANGAASRIRFVTAAGLGGRGLAGPFDAIIANILAGPLMALAPRVRGALRPGGALVLSGILVPQAAAVTATYRAHGFTLAHHRRIAGWSTLTFAKTS